MRKIVLVTFALLCAALLQAQTDSLNRGRTAAKIAQLSFSGESALWFTDAETGKPLEQVLVEIETTGKITTDAEGLAVFATPKDGAYRFTASKGGYMLLEDHFTVVFGSILFNRYSIPRQTSLTHVKIVLDWGKDPLDLDIHLVKENQYHISYREMHKSADSTVWLDRDETSGYGPETITITQIDNNALYHLYIHDYTNRNQSGSRKLSASSAVVRVYNENRLKNQFAVSTGKTGANWYVFDIINGNIRVENRYE